MCSPFEGSKPLDGIGLEVLSCMSALNMQPKPIPSDQQYPDNNGFLSDTDSWVKHALEHLRQAMQYTTKARRIVECVDCELLKLRLKGGIEEAEYDRLYNLLQELR